MEGTKTIINITDSDFQSYVLDSDRPVVVDFWAEWCPPCHMLSPIVEELSTEYADQVRFAKLNTDDNETTAAQFGVFSLPTLIVFQNGQEVNRMVGYAPKEQLKRQIDCSL